MVKAKSPDKAPEIYSALLGYAMGKNLANTVLQRTVVILPRSLADPEDPKPGLLELVMLNQGPTLTAELRAKAIGNIMAEQVRAGQLEVDLAQTQVAYQSIEGGPVDAKMDISSYLAVRCRLYRMEGWLSVVNYLLKTEEDGVEEICQSASGIPLIMPSLIWGVRAEPGTVFPGILNRYFPDRDNDSDWIPLSDLSANALMGATLIDPTNLRVLGHDAQD